MIQAPLSAIMLQTMFALTVQVEHGLSPCLIA
jgi:hypothetical protein